MSITYGSSHALTLLSASGHERYGDFARAPLLFPPLRCSVLNGWGMCLLFENHPRLCLGLQEIGALPPAETERQAHHLPVAPYGDVLPYLVVGPSQRVLYLLVALLDPVSERVKPHHLRQIRWQEYAFLGFLRAGSGKVCRQVPAGEMRECGRIGGRHDQPAVFLCSERPAFGLQCPPHLGMSITEAAFELDPFSGIVRATPVRSERDTLYPADLIHRMPPGVGRLQRQHIGYPLLLKPFLELAMLTVEDVPDHRSERETHLHGPLDQFKSYLGLGAEVGIHLCSLEVMRRSVGFDFNGIVDPLVHPKTRNGDDPIVYLADPAQILFSHVSRGFAVLAIPGLVHYQCAACLGSGSRVVEHNLHPAPVYLFRGPTRLGEEPLKTLRLFALRSQNRFSIGKSGQGFVPLGGQQ